MTLGELIDSGAARFEKAGVVLGQGTLEYRDESRWLALAALDLAIDSPASTEDTPVNQSQIARVEHFFSQRLHERRPAAYITGIAWLKGYAFHVDSRVIIPRSFIAELLVGKLYPFIQDPQRPLRILDLCTGSGCLAIIAADQFPNAQVLATDLCPEALEVAARNVSMHQLTHRVSLRQSDLYQAIDPAQCFDLIICNPPYVPQWKAAQMPQEFRHEPEMALYAQEDGMALVRTLLQGATPRLTAQGIVVVEIGHEFEACQEMLSRHFPGLSPTWIESEEQVDNVFILSRDELLTHNRSPQP